ncbi:NAD-dependent epimerase/dehydratase family protein [Candidatus Woesearchaeota archaeon]|nr:NAD-dependent epimerase/dehydratase family protein [Candidatus Woesearchaeota archaeon]
MAQKKVLVTGGAGFIGSHTVDKLLDHGYDVYVVDDLSTGRRDNLSDVVKFYETDIRDKTAFSAIVNIISPSIIVHLAASVNPGRSAKDPVSDAKINIEGTLNLYSAMIPLVEKNILKKIVFASTQASYGEGMHKCPNCCMVLKPDFRKPEDLLNKKFEHTCPNCQCYHLLPVPTAECCLQDPSMPYGVSKLAEEKYLLSFAQQFAIDAIALRYFNVYGPRQSSQGMETAVNAIFFNQLLNKNQMPLVFEDGLQTRDFVYVDDVARANLLAVECGQGIKKYNVGCDSASILEIAKLTMNVLRKSGNPNITHTPRALISSKGTMDTRHCQAYLNLIKKELNWLPKIHLEEGLQLTAEWALQNKNRL